MSNVIQLHALGYCPRCKRPIKLGENTYRSYRSVESDDGWTQEPTVIHMGICPSAQQPNDEPPPRAA